MNDEPNDPTIVPDEPLLNAKQVAKMLNVHILTVRRWDRTGELKSISLAKRVKRFRREDVYAFMRKRQKTTPKKIVRPPAPTKKRDRGR